MSSRGNVAFRTERKSDKLQVGTGGFDECDGAVSHHHVIPERLASRGMTARGRGAESTAKGQRAGDRDLTVDSKTMVGEHPRQDGIECRFA